MVSGKYGGVDLYIWNMALSYQLLQKLLTGQACDLGETFRMLRRIFLCLHPMLCATNDCFLNRPCV